MPAPTPQSEALPQARDHGLWGRADSPPDWQQALEGAIAGDPILVKDPTDPRDDFFLVPLRPADLTVHRSAWIMLDPVTLRLREAALLDHWKFPAFPSDDDARRIAQTVLHLPDGTRAQFARANLRPNRKNLVWRASEASILPYWPVKEWIAPHPVTGEPVSIYVTQEGEVLSTLTPVTPTTAPLPEKSPLLRLGLTLLVGVLIGIAANAWWHGQQRPAAPPPDRGQDPRLTTKLTNDPDPRHGHPIDPLDPNEDPPHGHPVDPPDDPIPDPPNGHPKETPRPSPVLPPTEKPRP